MSTLVVVEYSDQFKAEAGCRRTFSSTWATRSWP